ncbi:MAG TPA: ClbS/DfsB family four-helix bundle protein [Thermomicrobiales bacterium]|jgi:hypothetical protein
MAEPTTKAELLAWLRRERAGWETLLGEIDAARMRSPGAMGAWSFADLVAHLTAWQQPELARLAWAGGGAVPPLPWPAEWNPRHDQDRINDFIHARTTALPTADLLRAACETWDRLDAAIVALPEAILLTPGCFPWMDGEAVGPYVVREIAKHYHEDHEADLRAWLVGGRERG